MNNVAISKKIISEISSYENKKINFRNFVDNIEEFINAINGDDEFQTVLIRMWDKLEIPYALAAERGLKQIPQDDVPKIWEVIDNMKLLAENKIKEYNE